MIDNHHKIPNQLAKHLACLQQAANSEVLQNKLHTDLMKKIQIKLFNSLTNYIYCKVLSSRLSQLVAHLRIFRLFMKGKFDVYVL